MADKISHYQGLHTDALHLPPSPHRPPLPYVQRTLAELRRELVAREYGAPPASVTGGA